MTKAAPSSKAFAEKQRARSGFEIDIDGRTLPAPIDSTDDPFTAEQRATEKLTLRFNVLTPEEELGALADVAGAFQGAGAAMGNNPATLIALLSYKAKRALVEVGGKPVPHLSREAVWSGFGETYRQFFGGCYMRALAVDPEALDLASKSFRVVV